MIRASGRSMSNEAEECLVRILREFEEDTQTRYSHQRAVRMNEAISLAEASGRETEKLHAIWERDLALLKTRGSPVERKRLGGRFGPVATCEDGSQLPDPATFTDEALDYYAQRAEETSNPIHRARYCDFLWEKRREHHFARNAIDAYLDCLTVCLANRWYHEAADVVSRALELALGLSDGHRIKKVRERLLEAMDGLSATGDHPALRYCLDLIGTLLSMKRQITHKDLRKALAVCREGANFYASQDGGFDFHLAIEFEERQASLWHRLGNDKESDNALVRVGVLLEEEAELKGRGSNMSAALFLQEAIQHYANIGRAGKVQELKVKAKQRWKLATDRGEFKKMEATFRIPTRQIDEYARKIMSQGIGKALLAVSLELNLVPDIEQCRKTATEQKEEFPLLGLIPRSTVRGDRRVAFASTQDEIDEARAIWLYGMHLRLSQVCVGRVFEMMRQDGTLTMDSLAGYMSSSPFFNETKLRMILVGIERYFAGDYVSAIHILVPHLEDVLRRIIGELGVATTSFAPGGLTREKPLKEVLDSPEVMNLLGDRVWFYFKYVLDHQLGENLRNDVAHGLITQERCSRQLTETVIHLLLRLTPYEARTEASGI